MQAHRRHVRYFVMMGVCLGLFVLAWGVVRFFSVGAAIGMCVVAMVIPPLAAVLANRRDKDDDWWNDPRWDDPRWEQRGHDPDRPDREPPQDPWGGRRFGDPGFDDPRWDDPHWEQPGHDRDRPDREPPEER